MLRTTNQKIFVRRYKKNMLLYHFDESSYESQTFYLNYEKFDVKSYINCW